MIAAHDNDVLKDNLSLMPCFDCPVLASKAVEYTAEPGDEQPTIVLACRTHAPALIAAFEMGAKHFKPRIWDVGTLERTRRAAGAPLERTTGLGSLILRV